MDMNLILTLVVCFVCAVLSGLGVGSAGIFTLCLTMFLAYPQTEAQALNLGFFLFSASASLLIHRKERILPRRLILWLILFAVPGTLAGSYLARVLNPAILRRLFGGMLVVTGLLGLFGRRGRTGAQRGQ